MSLYRDLATHLANSPSTWTVQKRAANWAIVDQLGTPLEVRLRTKREATERLTTGPAARLWEKERRWYSGEPIQNWRPYAAL